MGFSPGWFFGGGTRAERADFIVDNTNGARRGERGRAADVGFELDILSPLRGWLHRPCHPSISAELHADGLYSPRCASPMAPRRGDLVRWCRCPRLWGDGAQALLCDVFAIRMSNGRAARLPAPPALPSRSPSPPCPHPRRETRVREVLCCHHRRRRR